MNELLLIFISWVGLIAFCWTTYEVLKRVLK